MKTVAAIYARLSREDEDKIEGSSESRSIENQIEFLTQYARNMNFDIYKIYYDDGYSGSNLNRPSFNLLLNDIKNKKFNTLLVKDLSRLGRSLHQVGELIETILPANNIRCIAVVDKYDSLTYNGDESIVLRNFLNAYYLKEFKRKVNKSLEHRAKTKHMTTSAKYGYLVKECGKVELDPYASQIVKRIFEQAIKGDKMPIIARQLNEDNILPRAKYYNDVLKLPSNHKHHISDTWTPSMIQSIIRDIEYCGHSVNLNYSTKETVVIKNTHPKIVTDEEYEIANQNTKRIIKYADKKPQNIGYMIRDSITNKTVKCSYHKTDKPYYYSPGTKFKMDINILHEVIYQDIISLITESKENMEKVFERIMLKRTTTNITNPQELKTKLKEFNDKYSKLFEDNLLGRLSDIKFQKESKNIHEEIVKLENLLNTLVLEESNKELLKKRFKHFVTHMDISNKAKLEIIKTCVKLVIVSKENYENKIRIIYKFE